MAPRIQAQAKCCPALEAPDLSNHSSPGTPDLVGIGWGQRIRILASSQMRQSVLRVQGLSELLLCRITLDHPTWPWEGSNTPPSLPRETAVPQDKRSHQGHTAGGGGGEPDCTCCPALCLPGYSSVTSPLQIPVPRRAERRRGGLG